MNYHTTDGATYYPHLKRERILPGEVMFTLVDARNGDTVASWVENDLGRSDNVDENTNYLEPDEEKNTDPYSVYVGNLRANVTKDMLVRYFAVVGEIVRVTLLRGRKEGKAYAAFIKFAEQEAAIRAQFLDKTNFMGNSIKVSMKRTNDGEDGDIQNNSEDEMDPLSVYIGNLDRRITTLELAGFLQQAGIVNKVTILRNKETGQNKGAAYAQFRDRVSMLRALTLDGRVVGGKCVKIRRKRKTMSVSEDEYVEIGNKRKRAMSEDEVFNIGIKRERSSSYSSDQEECSMIYEASSIYVGNLDPRTEKFDIEEHFKEIGDLVRVSILKGNRAAYAEFKDCDSVEEALTLDGSKLLDKDIKVKRKLLKAC